MQGFVVNDAEVSDITSAYQLSKKILLHEDSTADTYSRALPNSCYLSHLDLQFLQESGDTADHTKISAFLSWDDAGNDPMTAESVGNEGWDGLTTSSGETFLSTSIALNVWVTRPAGQTTSGKCYLHVRGNKASTEFTLKKARLHWAVRATI
jgi:hypothetical protein